MSCGVDFTIWIANGKAMGAGCPQYGQLGDGSDHAYNAKDSSICMVFDPQVLGDQMMCCESAEVNNIQIRRC